MIITPENCGYRHRLLGQAPHRHRLLGQATSKQLSNFKSWGLTLAYKNISVSKLGFLFSCDTFLFYSVSKKKGPWGRAVERDSGVRT